MDSFIDRKFQRFTPPPSGGEREQLEENLLRHGCCSRPVGAIASLLATTLERVLADVPVVKFTK
jgi:hypothetical protein